MTTFVIYKMTFPNSKCYIGITNDFNNRMRQHKYSSKNKQSKLYSAIRKHGWDNIQKEIIEENLDLSSGRMKESHYIELYDSRNNGYNLTTGGELSLHSEESKEKMRLYQNLDKVKKRKSEVSKLHISSQENKDKASRALLQYNKSQEHSDNIKRRWREDKEWVENITNKFKENQEIMILKSHSYESKLKRKTTIANKVKEGTYGSKGRIPWKKVICVETQEVFNSVKECSEKMNLLEKGIRRCVTEERKSYYNFHFKYMEVS